MINIPTISLWIFISISSNVGVLSIQMTNVNKQTAKKKVQIAQIA